MDNDIRNFHQVDRDLYRGARPAYRKDVYLKLVDLGIKTIVNLETGEASKEEAEVKQINQELSDRHLPQVTFIHFPISPILQVKLTGVPDGGGHGIRRLFEELRQAPMSARRVNHRFRRFGVQMTDGSHGSLRKCRIVERETPPHGVR